MTATEVNGIRVRTDTATLAPIRTRDGKPIWWEQTRTLTLEDGSVIYGCKHCDHTATKVGAIRPHLRVHADPNKPKRAPSGKDALTVVSKRLQKVDALEDQVAFWKKRCLAAERKISTWTQALYTLGVQLPDDDQ